MKFCAFLPAYLPNIPCEWVVQGSFFLHSLLIGGIESVTGALRSQLIISGNILPLKIILLCDDDGDSRGCNGSSSGSNSSNSSSSSNSSVNVPSPSPSNSSSSSSFSALVVGRLLPSGQPLLPVAAQLERHGSPGQDGSNLWRRGRKLRGPVSRTGWVRLLLRLLLVVLLLVNAGLARHRADPAELVPLRERVRHLWAANQVRREQNFVYDRLDIFFIHAKDAIAIVKVKLQRFLFLSPLVCLLEWGAPGTGDMHQALPRLVLCRTLMPSLWSANNLFFPITLALTISKAISTCLTDQLRGCWRNTSSPALVGWFRINISTCLTDQLRGCWRNTSSPALVGCW